MTRKRFFIVPFNFDLEENAEADEHSTKCEVRYRIVMVRKGLMSWERDNIKSYAGAKRVLACCERLAIACGDLA